MLEALEILCRREQGLPKLTRRPHVQMHQHGDFLEECALWTWPGHRSVRSGYSTGTCASGPWNILLALGLTGVHERAGAHGYWPNPALQPAIAGHLQESCGLKAVTWSSGPVMSIYSPFTTLQQSSKGRKARTLLHGCRRPSLRIVGPKRLRLVRSSGMQFRGLGICRKR